MSNKSTKPNNSSRSNNTNKNHKSTLSIQSPETLLQRGLELCENNQYELAIPFLQRSVEASNWNSPQSLDALGEALVEMGEFEDARQCFEKSVQIAPNESVTKWMFLGQLLGGKQALQSYERGIQLLEKELDSTMEQDDNQNNGGVGKMMMMGIVQNNSNIIREMHKKQLVQAQIAVAELFMSDLCMEPEAESRCETALAVARELDPNGVQPLQVTASMRISQHRVNEAIEIMNRVAAMVISSSLSSPSTSGMMDNPMEMLPAFAHDELPYDFRVQTCRLLVELGLFEQALTILECLVQEDDEMAEVWMLLGICHRGFISSTTTTTTTSRSTTTTTTNKGFYFGNNVGEENDEARDAAIECFERAEELLQEFVKHDPQSEVFQAQLNSVKELLKSV
jgi:tetratricopeptide (TPR) repeat protein